MPWYKTGKVNVVAGQTSVTGVGTDFAANSLVGDAFIGPDGQWYEVTNVPSATTLSISPAYRSATASNVNYALMPVQGYQRDLAIAAGGIIQQWGSTLAGLGAVSTENIVPVAKGGTGGTTQGEARTGLGLGTSAVATIVTGLTDVTAGRLPVVGWMGIGSAGGQPTLDTFLAHVPTGSYRAVGNVTTGSPITTATGAVVFAQRYSATDTVYRAFFPAPRRSFEGYYNGSTLIWTEYATDFNTESGSNANGNYLKMPDGTMIQWGASTGTTSASVASTYGSTAGTIYYVNQTIVFPVAFINSVYHSQAVAADRGIASLAISKTTSQFATQLQHISNSQVIPFTWLAIGRWKA
jgi:hypothetical protein